MLISNIIQKTVIKYLIHANVFMPPMFIAHEPQMPSRQERRKVKVGSISFLILISASKTIGPQLELYIFKSYTSKRNTRIIGKNFYTKHTCLSLLYSLASMVFYLVHLDSNDIQRKFLVWLQHFDSQRYANL